MGREPVDEAIRILVKGLPGRFEYVVRTLFQNLEQNRTVVGARLSHRHVASRGENLEERLPVAGGRYDVQDTVPDLRMQRRVFAEARRVFL